MELNDFERSLFRDMAFFAEDVTVFADLALRPPSLCSWRAMQLMGLQLVQEDAAADLTQATKEIAAYLWLHSAPLPEVCAALWDSSWKLILERMEEPAPAVVAEFAPWWTRVLTMVQAAAIAIRPRPPVKGDDTPKDLLPPEVLAYKIGHIAAFTGARLEHIKWRMFIGEALQHYHTAMHWHRSWTVKPAPETKAEDYGDLAPGFLKPEPPIDTTAPS